MNNGDCELGAGISGDRMLQYGGVGGCGGGLTVDPIYQLLKQAAEVGSNSSSRLKESGLSSSAISSSQRVDSDLQSRRPKSNASLTSSSSHMLTVSSHAPHHPSSSG